MHGIVGVRPGICDMSSACAVRTQSVPRWSSWRNTWIFSKYLLLIRHTSHICTLTQHSGNPKQCVNTADISYRTDSSCINVSKGRIMHICMALHQKCRIQSVKEGLLPHIPTNSSSDQCPGTFPSSLLMKGGYIRMLSYWIGATWAGCPNTINIISKWIKIASKMENVAEIRKQAEN